MVFREDPFVVNITSEIWAFTEKIIHVKISAWQENVSLTETQFVTILNKQACTVTFLYDLACDKKNW